MKIYSGSFAGKEDREKYIDYDLGVMVSPSPTFLPRKTFKDFVCALDNGAFMAHTKGYPFLEKYFYECMEQCYKLGIYLEFTVIPDILEAGVRSLQFSIEYIKKLPGGRLALAVQDGITPGDIMTYFGNDYSELKYIFVGGSIEWKWQTAKEWVGFAHSKGLLCHIGRCGMLDKLIYARDIGADSVDSTNFVRNKSWHVLDEFQNQKQMRMI